MNETGVSLLIVDDDDFNRDLLTHHLQQEGYADLEEAENGQQALEALAAKKFDLVILDIEMPVLDGIGTLRLLKQDPQLRNIPVIVVSGLDEFDKVVKCIELGAEDYLTKPFNAVLLKARLGASLEKKRLQDQEQLLRKQAEQLLHAILPVDIAEELNTNGRVQPRRLENVAVLMTDIVGFTPYCEIHSPEQVIADLQEISDRFESILDKYDLEKINATGDAFMAASKPGREPREAVIASVQFGLELDSAICLLASGLQMRIGIHIGPVVAGVVGRKKFLYSLFGDTVNTAARMESNGQSGVVCLSRAAWDLVADVCEGQSRGLVEIKGKGEMEIFYLTKVRG